MLLPVSRFNPTYGSTHFGSVHRLRRSQLTFSKPLPCIPYPSVASAHALEINKPE